MINYYEYIHSPEWFTRTEPVRKRNNGLCECCMMRYGNCVHHRTYQRLGEELEIDLLHVCIYCHRMIHKKGKYFIWISRIDFLIKLQEEIALELNSERDIDVSNLSTAKTTK